MWALGTKMMNLILHYTKISSDTSPPGANNHLCGFQMQFELMV